MSTVKENALGKIEITDTGFFQITDTLWHFLKTNIPPPVIF